MIGFLWLNLLAAPPSQVEVIWDGVAAAREAEVDNEMAAEVRPSARAGGVQRRAYFLHPNNERPATATWRVELPALAAGQRLVFSCWPGLSDGVKPEEGTMDGVGLAAEVNGRRLFRTRLERAAWQAAAVDLAEYAGQTITLRLLTDSGGDTGNCNYDWAQFGEPQILKLVGNAAVAGRTEVLAGALLAEHRGAPEGAMVRLQPLDGAGRPVAAALETPAAPTGLTLVDFDLTRLAGAAAVALEVAGAPGAPLTVAAHAPRIELVSLGSARGVNFAGQPVTARAVLRNTGRGVLMPEHGLTVTFAGDVEGRRPVARIMPGQEVTLEVSAPNPPPGHLRVALGAAYTVAGWPHAVDDSTILTVHPPRVAVSDAVVASGVKIGTAKSAAWSVHTLANRQLRVLLWGSGAGPVEFQAAVGTKYQTVATAPSLAEVVLEDGGEPVDWQVASPAPGTLAFTARAPLGGGERSIGLTVTCALEPGSKLLDLGLDLSAAPAGGYQLRALRGPAILVGDGTTGTRKRQALFPGLEYLDADDPSSSIRDLEPPLHLRTVPDPYKVTVPCMAIETAAATVALLWDPNQRWHARRHLPSAVFAAPNVIDGQNNHRLQLFAPGGVDLVDENTFAAREPYRVAAGEPVRLRQRILIDAGGTVLDAIDTWAGQAGGLLGPQPRPRPIDEQMALSRHGFMVSVWDAAARKSKHCVGWPNLNAPQYASLLYFDALTTGSDEARRHGQLIVDTTLAEEGEGAINSAAGCHILRNNAPFFYGHLDAALAEMRRGARQAIGSLNPDGTVGYRRPPENALLGEEGAVELGLTALNSMAIWRWARFSGDPEVLEAGRKTLAAMDKFIYPAGAQGWECPIHQPDVLAAAYAIRAYLEAFRVTGERRLLERAVYWARTGLPFNYLWDDPAKPGMRYAGIPCFGSTFRTHSWIGLPVQWCALVYAYGLQQLAPYDDSRPWAQVAEGIAVSAMYQQCGDGDPAELRGSYPDSWGLHFTRKNGAYINPEDILVVDLAARGHDPEPQTAIVTIGRRKLHITTGALIRSARVVGEAAVLLLERPAGATTFGMVPFCGPPATITIGGAPARMGADIDAADVDAVYDARQATLFFKVAHGPRPVEVRLGGLKPGTPAGRPERTRWAFDDGPQGWTGQNHVQLSRRGGSLVATVTGADPYLGCDNAWFAAARHPRLVVRARMTGGGRLGLFWGTAQAEGTSPEREATADLPGDGQWHEVVFDLSGHPGWRGDVNLLRLDLEPADLPVGSELEIDWIEARAATRR